MHPRSMHPRSTNVCHMMVGAARVALCFAAVAAGVDVAEAKPRVERITDRRLMRLESMERRMEAAAQLPPRPADVRRAIRSGVPVSGLGPNPGAAATAAARPTPRPAAPGAVAPQPRPPVAAARPRVVAPPQQARPVPSPAVEPAQAVSPVTAIDDGTRSVLVGGEPTLAAPAAGEQPIEPIELLPPPSAK